ncbi:hypothetical protein EBR37_02685 [bacterium]|nr:hypothetical protein [bacterium]
MERMNGLGGTDAMRIMNGDWHNLYMEKLGLAEPVDLSENFQVQLGRETETFHINWVAGKNDWIINPIDKIMSPRIPFMFAHLDGWIQELDTFIEVKHTNEWQSASEKARYYMPQLQHYLHVTDKPYAYFSIIRGNQDPELLLINADQNYQSNLLERLSAFWWHVENKVPPEGDEMPQGQIGIANKLADNVPVNNMRKVDMNSSNSWAEFARVFLDTKDKVKEHDLAKTNLKDLIPNDVGEAYGHGVFIKRNKKGALTIYTEKDNAE